MRQTYCNTPADCQWLRETHLAEKNWNNANPIPDFQSFCLFGNEDCPEEILIYREAHPTIKDKPVRAMLTDNGGYSFFRV
jgi:hypothetical protein